MTTTTNPISEQSSTKTILQTQQAIDRLLRWPDVQPLVGICRAHAHQLAAAGLFPMQIKLVENGRASAWIESEIREWIEGRVAASRPTDSAA